MPVEPRKDRSSDKNDPPIENKNTVNATDKLGDEDFIHKFITFDKTTRKNNPAYGLNPQHSFSARH